MTIRRLQTTNRPPSNIDPDPDPDTDANTLLHHPPAGLPSKNPTASYWLRDLSPALRGHRSSPHLPREADVVIVGSGVSGAFAGLFLLEGLGGGSGGGGARGERAGREARGDRGGGGGGGDGGETDGGKEEGEGEGTGAAGRGKAEERFEDERTESGTGTGEGGAEAGLRVVMLEAREACSGATGRNGGHCQPLVYGSAPEVAAFELEVFEFLERFVKEEGVDCDWVSLTGVHAFLSKDMFEVAAAEAEQLRQSHPELAAQLEVVRPVSSENGTTLASLRIPSAQGAIVQRKAASLWPYKLVAAVLERLISKFPAPRFNLQTNTPVTSLARDDSGVGWVVSTPRGAIAARQVLLATNGYTSHLLPAFADLIVPVRGQVGALLPPRSDQSAAPAKLTHSYVFAADPEPGSTSPSSPRDDYLVQRPLPTGELIYGGGRRFARDLGVGEWRDDEVEEDLAAYLRSSLSPPLDLTQDELQTKEGPQPPGGRGALKASFEWTGVMGYSRDHHPWVGPVPETLGGGGPQGGLFVCAGYTGHGMPAAALSAREVVRQMVGGDVKARAGRFPAAFALTEERVARARELPPLTQGWEATNFAALMAGKGASGAGKAA